MKILFWLLALASIPMGLFISIVSYLSHGLDLSYTWFGQVICFAGMLSVAISIVCAVRGIIKLHKGDVKKAVAAVLLGIAYAGTVFAGFYIENAVNTMIMNRDIARQKEEMYGENWDSDPAIGNIPEPYVKLLNEFYAIAKNELEYNLVGFGLPSMPNYYGGAPLDNIGFSLMDVNGDNVNELVVGTAAPVEAGGTAIFCIYSDPEDPISTVFATEGEIYFLHFDEAEGKYLAEIDGQDAAWQLLTIAGKSAVDIDYVEGAMDSAGRLTLDMIPFSLYK